MPILTGTIDLGDLQVEVILKDIKNINLRVYPPTGRVRISAPFHTSLYTIRAFAISKSAWIKHVQKRLRRRANVTPLKFTNGETHDVWGDHYLLDVIEKEAQPRVHVEGSSLVLQVRPGTGRPKREAIVDRWYHDQLKEVVPALIEKWEAIIGVKVAALFVRKMKSRWGTCNLSAGSIRLNSKLAKKHRECLEYVVVHEMVHLVEPTHGQRFKALMDRFMPPWRHQKAMLALLG